MTKKKESTKTKKATKKKPKKEKQTLKEKLIEKAQKLIGVANVDRNTLYSFVMREDKLAFCKFKDMFLPDTNIINIQGAKILKGLEEHHWDVYGDAFVWWLKPKQIECTENSIDESATMPGEEKPELI